MNPAPLLLALAALLDVGANALLKKSDGFRRLGPGILALALVLLAFGLLGVSLKTVPLATAYATWGGLGLALSALLSRWLDGTRLTPTAWAGLLLIGASVAALHHLHG